MNRSLRNAILKTQGIATEPEDSVQVLVALKVDRPEPAQIDELRTLGLDVSESIANKVVGTIRSDRLKALQTNDLVAEVELSERLCLH